MKYFEETRRLNEKIYTNKTLIVKSKGAVTLQRMIERMSSV